MGSELLEIEPRELKFTFELKKQSSCSVRLANKSNEYVAFKVKTTNPKRYCVRPNTGVVLPRSTCDFTVTMQAQRVAPPDMQLKDKFLVQTTAVPFGTTDEEIVPSFFSKENGRYIEEHKLRVSLSPPHSPVSHPVNGASKQEPAYENLIIKETPSSKEEILNGNENNELSNGAENLHPIDVAKDVEDLTLKLNNLEMKLKEADTTITVLREEKSVAIQERDKLQQEIADKIIPMPREEKIVASQDWDKLQQEIVLLRRKCASGVQVGFPLMFVVFIALVGVALGYMLHP